MAAGAFVAGLLLGYSAWTQAGQSLPVAGYSAAREVPGAHETNDVFKSRFNGPENPKLALIHELKQAGVDFRVCGQALLGKKIEPSMLLSDKVDLWAMTTMVNRQLRGYVRIGG